MRAAGFVRPIEAIVGDLSPPAKFCAAFVIFRQRHARMVERVIGRRTGTGGSSGVDYLDQTALKYRIFTDIWSVRTILVRQALLPPLESAESYGFVVET